MGDIEYEDAIPRIGISNDAATHIYEVTGKLYEKHHIFGLGINQAKGVVFAAFWDTWRRKYHDRLVKDSSGRAKK